MFDTYVQASLSNSRPFVDENNRILFLYVCQFSSNERNNNYFFTDWQIRIIKQALNTGSCKLQSLLLCNEINSHSSAFESRMKIEYHFRLHMVISDILPD